MGGNAMAFGHPIEAIKEFGLEPHPGSGRNTDG
jgi:hypothetical protein